MLIYVLLKNEGTTVYRPVDATPVTSCIYRLGGFDYYDPEDEEWEFVPGQEVYAEERMLGDELVFVATGSAD